jgi:hypothetical protein
MALTTLHVPIFVGTLGIHDVERSHVPIFWRVVNCDNVIRNQSRASAVAVGQICRDHFILDVLFHPHRTGNCTQSHICGGRLLEFEVVCWRSRCHPFAESCLHKDFRENGSYDWNAHRIASSKKHLVIAKARESSSEQRILGWKPLHG